MDKEFELILENTCHASKTKNLVNLATSSGAKFLQRAEVFCEKNTPLSSFQLLRCTKVEDVSLNVSRRNFHPLGIESILLVLHAYNI